MLQLHSNKFRSTYNNQSWYANSSDRLDCGHREIRLQNGEYYFRSPSPIYHADLPLHMNGFKLHRFYFKYNSNETTNLTEVEDGIASKLSILFNDTEAEDIVFITGYLGDDTLENKDFNYAFIDTDIWKEHKDDAIISLFNKCVEQTSLRESERQGRNIKQHIRVFQSKVKHIILMLTDYADIDQESETFLALGLTPVMFEDIKDSFEETEIDYFKCLVNRSQVKRISNVKATNCFSALESINKYIDMERTIRYQTLFKRVAEARVYAAENITRQYRDQAEQALRNYDTAIKKVNENQIIIDKYKEGAKDIEEELKTIASTKGVLDIDNSQLMSNTIRIVLRVPLDYFDSDEAECAIRNVQSDAVKKFIKDIFIDQKYKLYIRTEANYAYVQEQPFQDFMAVNENDFKASNALFNPHFQYFHCLGDYKPSLIKAMRDQDITLFTNIALAAARSMNFKDGAVCTRWFAWLADAFQTEWYREIKCLEKDGELISLGEWYDQEVTHEETTN